MIETLETILVVVLLIYVVVLTINEISYMSRGYKVIKYVPKRKTEYIWRIK